jgi:RNA polymerase sigma factor (sigma-70 family)
MSSPTRAEKQRALLAEYRTAEADGNKRRIKAIEAQVISENYSLVLQLTKKYTHRLTIPLVLNEAEVVQAGLMGLLLGWRGWEPTRGALSTYVGWRVRWEVQTLISQSLLFKAKSLGKPWQVFRAQEIFHAQHGRDPNAEECNAKLESLGLPLRVTAEQLEVWRVAPSVLSFEAMTAEDDETHATRDRNNPYIPKFQLSEQRPNPEQACDRAEMAESLMAAMQTLTEAEQIILERTVMGEETLVDVAEDLGISDERAKRIRLGALEKLRTRVPT